jgi:DNA (cytosine-5)-methyltransferase 1
MTHLDLFSGIGGFALAARWAGIETVQFVEYEPYAQKVLAKNFPKIPIAGDIFEFDATKFLGVGLVTGGFPCQPFSVAGKQLGNKDDRAIWPQMLRVIREARPTWVIGENVSGIIQMELDNVLSDLEGEGYTTQTLVIPAAGVDAKHRRERVWILAHTTGTRRSGGEGCMETDGCNLREEVQTRLGTSEDLANSNSGLCNRENQEIFTGGNTTNNGSEDVASSNSSNDPHQEGERKEGNSGSESSGANGRSGIRKTDVANSMCKRQSGQGEYVKSFNSEKNKEGEAGYVKSNSGPVLWLPEPDVGRVANGVPSRVDRLKGLGNAIVPQVAFEIMRHMKI